MKGKKLEHHPRRMNLSVYLGQEINSLRVSEYVKGSKVATFVCTLRGEGCRGTIVEKISAVLNHQVKSCGCLQRTKGKGQKTIHNNDPIELLLFHTPWV